MVERTRFKDILDAAQRRDRPPRWSPPSQRTRSYPRMVMPPVHDDVIVENRDETWDRLGDFA